jgi:hypothetical protein
LFVSILKLLFRLTGQMMREIKLLGGVLVVWFNGISTLSLKAHAPPAQPTASQMPRERLAT